MLNNIMYVTLYVTDQDKALRFYTEGLGLEKRVDYPGPEGRFLTVGVANSPVEIILWQGEPAFTPSGARQGPGSGLPRVRRPEAGVRVTPRPGGRLRGARTHGLPVRRPHHGARPGWQPHRAPPATLTWSCRRLTTRPAWPTPPGVGHATDSRPTSHRAPRRRRSPHLAAPYACVPARRRAQPRRSRPRRGVPPAGDR